jgi:hypothetical protein
VARHSDQERIRASYQGVLGCLLTRESANVDYIKSHQGFFLAVLNQEAVPTQEQLRQSIWLELRSDEPAELRKKIVDFGVTEVEMPGADHLYFQAPGDQVFRVTRLPSGWRDANPYSFITSGRRSQATRRRHRSQLGRPTLRPCLEPAFRCQARPTTERPIEPRRKSGSRR